MIKPITPDEVKKYIDDILPEEVIKAFNDLIIENFKHNQSIIYQKDVASKIAKSLNITVEKVFEKGYLNIEEIFSKNGWHVQYDKPAYNEDYKAYFRFTKKKD